MNREELLKIAKPILFNTEMTQATLENRKTATRRVIKPQPVNGIRKSVFVPSGLEDGHGREIKPKYKVGDILYARETWAPVFQKNIVDSYAYKASRDTLPLNQTERWFPSIHMPKKAARIFLKVTNVRVERLQDISNQEAHKEGVKATGSDVYCGHGIASSQWDFSVEKFTTLWDSTIKKQDLDKYGWEANPWVWVIEFERVEV